MNINLNEKILVSACLMGVCCRWHGKKIYKSSALKKLQEERPDITLIPICPETIAGLPTPRPPVKRISGHVYETCPEKANRKNVTGRDVTDYFINGAKKVLKIAKKHKINTAVLCKWSPSCDASGITGRLLIKNNIKIINTW